MDNLFLIQLMNDPLVSYSAFPLSDQCYNRSITWPLTFYSFGESYWFINKDIKKITKKNFERKYCSIVEGNYFINSSKKYIYKYSF